MNPKYRIITNMQWRPSSIIALRIIANLSQAQLGDLVGVARQRIGNLENRDKPVTAVLAASFHLVRRLKDISIKEIEEEIQASPYLTRKDGV
jgi:DNA-binding XRE family transcriptional regulator